MSPINPKAACGVWCALLLCASGEITPPNSGDLLQADMAARLREMSNSGNRPDAHRRMSPEMLAISGNPDLLDNLGAEDLAKMTLDDPLLKWAYASVFLRSTGPLEQLEPPLEMVLSDIRRRGEAVSPMFLKLIEENRESRIESSVLGQIEHLGTVDIAPFLEYARKLLRERTRSDVVAEASGLLAQRGTKDDIELFERVLRQGPFAVTDLTGNLKILKARLDQPASAPRPERREAPSSKTGSHARSGKDTDGHPQDGVPAALWTKPWLIGGIVLAMLLGLYRLMSKRQHGQSS